MSRPAIKRGFVPQWIFERGFSITQREVLLYVMMRGDCFENKRKMASTLRIGINTLRKTLGELEALQWIVKTSKLIPGSKTRSNCYTLAPIEGIRADVKRRLTHGQRLQPEPQTNASLAIYSANEKPKIANDSKKPMPSKILTQSKEPRSGDQRGVPNGPQSPEDGPQKPFKPEVVEGKAKPPKKRPATENPYERGTGEWIAWMVENGYGQFALTVGFDHWQIKHEAKPKKREKWG